MYTPDPTISNPQHQKVAGCTQLDIPSGELIRENTTGEPFEVIKLLHDSVLPHAHVYWHSGGWHAVSARLEPVEPEDDAGPRRFVVVPNDRVEEVHVNHASARGSGGSGAVFELPSGAAARIVVMGGGDDEPEAGGVGCEDGGWVLT